MLHPSYSDLMKIVNSEAEGDTPLVNSRYSIVMATAKRARQIIAGEAMVSEKEALKPLSTAVKELNEGRIHILPDTPEELEADDLQPVEEELILDEEETDGEVLISDGEDAGEDAQSGEETIVD